MLAYQVDDQSMVNLTADVITKIETMKLKTLKQNNIADYSNQN